jgi:tetraacyldisaccharide 4'-kinase
MRAPSFWYRPTDIRGALLSPLGSLYALATKRRVAQPAKTKTQAKTICVGNINAGGTGKTPTTIALIQQLAERGNSVACLSRGYGGSLNGPILVTPQHTADQVGDEPLLLSAFAPTIVAKDRSAGAAFADTLGVDVILMDDGFQNPDVSKDASIVVVDAVKAFGNGRTIPAGPLREPVQAGLKRADLLLSIGPQPAQKTFEEQWGKSIHCPHVTGHLVPLQTGMVWTDLPVLAFAGIGHPEKFFATLKAVGADIKRAEALADHQPLTPALMARLAAEARALPAQLITTEKDAVRLPDAFKSKVLALPVRLAFHDKTEINALLDRLGL